MYDVNYSAMKLYLVLVSNAFSSALRRVRGLVLSGKLDLILGNGIVFLFLDCLVLWPVHGVGHLQP